MGLPNISIEFRTLGVSAIQRSEKGVVGIILRDSTNAGAHVLTRVSQIPQTLSEKNLKYVKRAFLGYITPPRKVVLFVLGAEAESLSDALSYMENEVIDYIAGPPEIGDSDKSEIVSWIKEQRMSSRTPKAVLPNTAADNCGIINFTSEDIQAGGETFTAAEYCSRIAGLIAGTPMIISCTYAPLPEVGSIKPLSKDAQNAAVDNGEFILISDGGKVKAGRGVNSYVTVTEGLGEVFKKIKVVEAIDMMQNDIRTTAQDSYIGKYANSYDNKCLLITAIRAYFEGLERAGILAPGKSSVGIDLEAVELYLSQTGIDTESMDEQALKEANTGSNVFLFAKVSILDAIEDIELYVEI